MSYVTRLIGNIEPGIENPDGKLFLPDISITEAHILDPTKLRDDYGDLGKGLEHIVSNTHLNKILVQGNGSDIIVRADGITGLDNAPEAERNVVQALLTKQYDRSRMLYRLASNKELQDYDDVTKGVFKGTGLGGLVGGSLQGGQYLLVKTGLAALSEDHIGKWFNTLVSVAADVAAKAGPGIAEATGITHEVLGKENGESAEKNMLELLWDSAKEFPGDSLIIAKACFDGKLWYDAANIGGWLDKEKNKRDRYTSRTKEWAAAQQSAPPRGLAAYTLIRVVKDATPVLEYFPGAGWVLSVGEGLASAYINVGNNAQGGYNDFMNCLADAKAAGSQEPYQDALREYFSDPFQAANFGVVLTWNLAAVGLRLAGLNPEKLGPIGAGLESSVLSWDTAAAAQFAKPLSYALVVVPSRYSVKPDNLMKLALEHQATGLQEQLMGYRRTRKALA